MEKKNNNNNNNTRMNEWMNEWAYNILAYVTECFQTRFPYIIGSAHGRHIVNQAF